jgi:hypothetical protein
MHHDRTDCGRKISRFPLGLRAASSQDFQRAIFRIFAGARDAAVHSLGIWQVYKGPAALQIAHAM